MTAAVRSVSHASHGDPSVSISGLGRGNDRVSIDCQEMFSQPDRLTRRGRPRKTLTDCTSICISTIHAFANVRLTRTECLDQITYDSLAVSCRILETTAAD